MLSKSVFVPILINTRLSDAFFFAPKPWTYFEWMRKLKYSVCAKIQAQAYNLVVMEYLVAAKTILLALLIDIAYRFIRVRHRTHSYDALDTQTAAWIDTSPAKSINVHNAIQFDVKNGRPQAVLRE